MLTVANLGTEMPEGTDWRLVDAGAVAFLAFGALLALRLPSNPVSWIALAAGLTQVAAVVANEWAVLALLTRDGELPGGGTAQWIGIWVWLPGYCLVPTLLLLLFPDGRPPSARWRPLVPVTLAVVALVAAWFALVPYDDLGEAVIDPGAARPLESSDAAAVLAPFSALLIPCVLLCAGSVAVRLRRASGEERQQLRWFGAGVVVALLFLLAGQAIDGFGPAGVAIALTVLPAAVFVAVVRHGLWELGPSRAARSCTPC